MAAATKDAYIKQASGNARSYGVEASEIIYDGALVGSNGSGYAQAFADGNTFLGVAVDGQADNSTGAAGDIDILVRNKVILQFAVTGVADIDDTGAKVYATDDSTLSLTDSGSDTCVGRIDSFVSAGVALVEFDTNAQV